MYRRATLLSILLFFAIASLPTFATATPYMVVDADSGMVLDEYKADHRWYPASLTKLMTAYVTFRAIKAGEIEPGSPVEISRVAAKQPPSRMGYKHGVRLRIDTALKIIIVKSANDVSYALGEAVAGSLGAFIERMNQEAARLGMSNTRFANSNGLHNKNQYTSARDMALLSAQILNEFPQYTYLYKAVAIKTPVKTHYSYNLLLERLPGTTGMKTGFVCASGFNMVASAKINGRNLIAVVLGENSQTDRAVTAARLLKANTSQTGRNSVWAARNAGPAPKNMRPILCTKEARESRYEPGAGNAKINSKFLQPRQKSNDILAINTGGIDAPASDAWISRNVVVKGKPPIPSPRPNFDPVLGKIILAAIGNRETGKIAVPTPRPR